MLPAHASADRDPAPYHHGDLRAYLLTLAESEVEAVGHEALELKSLAEKAGVSKAAPYRHFRNREDLLIALAIRGFGLMKGRNACAASIRGTATDRLRAACQALVDFATDRPQLYRMMFASDLMRRFYSPRTWGEVVRESYELFEATVAATMPNASIRDIRAAALACLASLQGFILLRSSARMEYLLLGEETEESLLQKILRPHLGKRLKNRKGEAP